MIYYLAIVVERTDLNPCLCGVFSREVERSSGSIDVIKKDNFLLGDIFVPLQQ